MILGAVLLTAALSLFCWNRYEDRSSGRAAESLTAEVIEAISAGAASPQTSSAEAEESHEAGETEDSGQEAAPTEHMSEDERLSSEAVPFGETEEAEPRETAMSAAWIDGHGYIGVLRIQSLGLELGVMSEWSYANLKLSPCRYSGSTDEDNLVICGHNYSRHFGHLGQIAVGDEVLFTDMEGESIRYEVITVETLEPTAIGEMTSGEYDLTLFTCTYGGTARTAVRCDRAS